METNTLASRIERANKTLSLVNRWGAKLAIGNRVLVAHPRGGYSEGVISRFETTGEYARAYGPRVILTSGGSCSVDDCRIP